VTHIRITMADANDEDLYDEFGNYIGPELDSSSDEESSLEEEENDGQQDAPDDASDVSDDHNKNNAMVVAGEVQDKSATADPMNAIVLHEDKDHYPSAEQTFGEGVRTAVLDEDAMDLDTPIVEPVVIKTHHADSGASTEYIYNDEYLTTILSNETTRNRRGIALVGHFHHGKTSLIDCLMEPTLQKPWGPRAALEGQAPRFTDMLKTEQEREMSLVSTPLTLLLSDTRGKTHGITLVDCPGHTHFHDESVAALRSVDGAVVVVDAVEGVMMHTELLLRQIVSDGLPVMLCIAKVDRLITELKLPPRDAYYKLLNLVETANQILEKASCGRFKELLHPAKGNVCFSSALHGWMFTLSSFAQVYADHNDDSLGNISIEEFGKRLWGDWYWDEETKKFYGSPKYCSSPRVERSFVAFCLEPLYKIYTACLGEQEENANKLLRSLGILLKKEQLRSSARPLLRAALSKFFETATCGFVDMIVQHT
jgi:U5 small nuclear ribonucleoprotein component